MQEFLEKEIKVLEEILLSEMDVISPGKIENKAQKGKTYFAYDLPAEEKLKCHICSKNDHNVTKDFKNRCNSVLCLQNICRNESARKI